MISKKKRCHMKSYTTLTIIMQSEAHTVPHARVGLLLKDPTPHGILKVHEYEHKEPVQSTSNKKYFCILKTNERQKNKNKAKISQLKQN
jgi:hypothetical protein